MNTETGQITLNRFRDVINKEPTNPWIVAAMEGNLRSFEQLRTEYRICFDKRVCLVAALFGRLDALRWLRSQNPPCPWDERTCALAAVFAPLEVLKWLRSQDPPCPWDKSMCSYAVSFGRLDVLVWGSNQSPPCPWDLRCINGAKKDLLRLISSNRCSQEERARLLEDHLGVLDWLTHNPLWVKKNK